MAAGKGNGLWPVWIVVIVAIIFVVLAFMKEKPADVSSSGPRSSADQMMSDSGALKPAHSSADQARVGLVKPAEAIIVPLQAVPIQDRFAVQVYSFKEKARADASFQKLKDKGYKAYVMVSDLGARGTWYRVRVGPYTDELEVQKVLESVTEDFKSGIIVSE